jgi:hypothetical protein
MSKSDFIVQPGWQRHLAPYGGQRPTGGWTKELHGPEGRLMPGYVPTAHEVMILLRYWAGRVAKSEKQMGDGSYDPALARVERFGEERLEAIETVLGKAAVDDAVAMARAIDGLWEPHKSV